MLWPSLFSSASFGADFRADIEKAVARWWPDYPNPDRYHAQLIVESGLRRHAVSPAGARGLAQFMPATWAEVSRELGVVASPHDDIAIEAGAYYMAKNRRAWDRHGRTPHEVHELAEGSYNCGRGCMIAAQRRCGHGRLFADIAPCLPAETRAYVPKIDRAEARLKGGSKPAGTGVRMGTAGKTPAGLAPMRSSAHVPANARFKDEIHVRQIARL